MKHSRSALPSVVVENPSKNLDFTGNNDIVSITLSNSLPKKKKKAVHSIMKIAFESLNVNPLDSVTS